MRNQKNVDVALEQSSEAYSDVDWLFKLNY